ncbi:MULTISPECIES: hypothetical protein [Kitasatospora]|uniref:Uncharacterized protein n=1 Tax=Kitasatospora setae (strain ATCC 33774 / DSM 43861 / JCM 3304 / KCC A-0304 / NBRC 14216 / KM-6054) TaxID=452652 RepID=E4N3D7_KITSK|nr:MULTISPECIES: hypothetical protein [Kitasatospora]BAJ32671.1 hypothetical protein KSE_69130 [Kitasatospora setae KM-6054]
MSRCAAAAPGAALTGLAVLGGLVPLAAPVAAADSASADSTLTGNTSPADSAPSVAGAEQLPERLQPLPPMPAAEAYDGDTRLAAPDEVAAQCDRPGTCTFRVTDRIVGLFGSAVASIGNAAINCTGDDMEIDRSLTVASSSTDNISGSISGKATVTGSIDTTVTASAQGSLGAGITNGTVQYGPSKDKGPTTQDKFQSTTDITGTVAGSNALHLGAKASFELAFQASYAKQWQASVKETTRVVFTISSNDEIQFGAINAVTRVVGVLSVDHTGRFIKNVVVDSPSIATSSSIVAQTFSRPDVCLSLRPPGRAVVEPGPVEVAPEPPGRAPDAVYARAADGTWSKR